jgi:hypothetical protein
LRDDPANESNRPKPTPVRAAWLPWSLQAAPQATGHYLNDLLKGKKSLVVHIRLQIKLLGDAPHDSWSTAAAAACSLACETPEIIMNRLPSNWHTYCPEYYAIVFS